MNLWRYLDGETPETPENLVFQQRKSKEIHEICQDLAPSQKKIIRLMYEEDLSQREIAKRLKWTLQQVKYQHRCAIQQIRVELCRRRRQEAVSHPSLEGLRCSI